MIPAQTMHSARSGTVRSHLHACLKPLVQHQRPQCRLTPRQQCVPLAGNGRRRRQAQHGRTKSTGVFNGTGQVWV